MVLRLKTLYIDIYFLINFTVDLISLYFAALFTKLKISNKRLLITAVIGAVSACLLIFTNAKLLYILGLTVSIVIMITICTYKITLKRKVVFGFSLMMFLSFIGGIVNFMWEILADIFSGYLIENDIVNRKMLFLSLIILLSIGVCKMMITVLKNGRIETKIVFEIKFLGKTCSSEAMIDTGNLAIDPLGMKPVFIIKEELAKTFLSENVINLTDVDHIEKNIKKKIRLIPLSKDGATHMYVGIVPDEVTVIHKGKKEFIDVTIAIDKEGGDFGGFMALMPFSAVENVFD